MLKFKPYNSMAYFLDSDERKDYRDLLIRGLCEYEHIIVDLDDVELMNLNDSENKRVWLEEHINSL